MHYPLHGEGTDRAEKLVSTRDDRRKSIDIDSQINVRILIVRSGQKRTERLYGAHVWAFVEHGRNDLLQDSWPSAHGFPDAVQ